VGAVPVALEKRVLSLVGELIGLVELDEFCAGLLHALREAVPSDWSALNELPAELPRTVSLSEPSVPDELHQVFARLGTQNPIADHFIRTGDGRATRISDLVSRRQLHQLELYQRVYRQLGIEYQIAFTLPSQAARILGVVLSREQKDFSARERDLLNLARPYVIQLYRNALAHTMNGHGSQIKLENLERLGLTRRQAEVLRLVATGHTAPEAAAALGIASRTAQKHLEHCYRMLGVTNRSEASRAAWAAAG
jgi:DNA-binding CsgD family transcriptional regulator